MVPPGTRLGPYEILASLGEGGMGEVYHARDTRLARAVAIKVLPADFSQDADRRARFEREARAVAALSHPHICRLFDVGRDHGVDYLVMELIEGESLADRLGRGPLSLVELITLGTQIAEALDCAHRAGVVHRDVKPANIMVSGAGATLMDFGLARTEVPVAVRHHDGQTTAPRTSAPVTAHGAIVGTIHYMSPEQLDGRQADARSDVWALGCVLYEMATGRRAFDGSAPATIIAAILREDPRPISETASVMPSALDHVVRTCLARDPEQRWQRARDVALALRGITAEDRGAAAAQADTLVERSFVLTARHVRQLSERNPRLVGYTLNYLDNGATSDILVVFLHGIGADASRFEPVLRALPQRAVAVTLVGFGRRERNRPTLAFDDHSRVLRVLLRHIADECRPRHIVLVGHSAGADHLLRMLHDEPGAGVDVAGLVALGPNVSLDTCFASRLYARIDAGDPAGTLAILKSLAQGIESLETWLVVQNYFSQMFLAMGSELEPLRRYAADLVDPFLRPGDPLAEWYLSARKRVPHVRLVFSNEETAAAEALLARHLESNAFGDDFTEDSFVVERVHHLSLLEPDLILRHVREVIASLG
ncbi:MAG: alpha/beta fold hydrolase [Acidobacteria bacterium]|nr:alpha/beta fold hydrolase [Acidobacteriota bacterium]